jgi:riboflavin synthase
MFTGIVEELGVVAATSRGRVRLACREVLADVSPGASIAVNGCCLTVVDFAPPGDTEPGWWEADLSDETLARTSLGSLQPGDRVNLERPVRLADRLGGHLVQGHVDAVGTLTNPPPDLVVAAPPEVVRYLVPKGSVTVDGVSLTVVDVFDDRFSVAVIPHTAAVTTLGHKAPGSAVNLEVDVLAKYTERLLAPYPSPEAGDVPPSSDPAPHDPR